MTPPLPGLEDLLAPEPPPDWEGALRRVAGKPGRLAVLQALREIAAGQPHCYPSNARILERLAPTRPMRERALVLHLAGLEEDGLIARTGASCTSGRKIAFTFDSRRGGANTLRPRAQTPCAPGRKHLAPPGANTLRPPPAQVQEPPPPAPPPPAPLNSEELRGEETLRSRAREGGGDGGGRKPDPPKAGPARTCDLMARLARLAEREPAAADEPALTPRLERWPDPVPAPAPAPAPGPYPAAPDTDTAVRRLGNPAFDQAGAVADAAARIATLMDDWKSLAFISAACYDVSTGAMPAAVLRTYQARNPKVFTSAIQRYRQSPGAQQKTRPRGKPPRGRASTDLVSSPANLT